MMSKFKVIFSYNMPINLLISIVDDARVDIDCNYKLVRTLSRLYQTSPDKYTQPDTPAPEYTEFESKRKTWATKLNIVI